MFDRILLEPEQEELLVAIVEAARGTPRDQRRKFLFVPYPGGSFLQHPGFGRRTHEVYKGDIEILGQEGLLALSYSGKGSITFDVKPLGFKYYEQLKKLMGEPIQQLETSIRNFLDADAFQKKYPLAYQKWVTAENLLWSSDSEKQLSLIGHTCREAVQEFATALVEQHSPPDVDSNKALTVSRLKAVITVKKKDLGPAVEELLDALVVYWGTTNDIIQRQEHSGQKENRPLVWEDARRVVFNTAIVMFELDHALSCPPVFQ